ncbi:hypothetical protein T484DRAFT_1987670 [Baffinella frigidus]|nr:hypothetical protein T484DRAFT_1987670 [Cryptophyta sp. CCMP2293]
MVPPARFGHLVPSAAEARRGGPREPGGEAEVSAEERRGEERRGGLRGEAGAPEEGRGGLPAEESRGGVDAPGGGAAEQGGAAAEEGRGGLQDLANKQNPAAPDGFSTGPPRSDKMHLRLRRSSLRSTSEPWVPPTAARGRRSSLTWNASIETVCIIPRREQLNRTLEGPKKTTLPPPLHLIPVTASTLAGERRSRLLALYPRGQVAMPREAAHSGHVAPEVPKWQQDVASLAGAKQLFCNRLKLPAAGQTSAGKFSPRGPVLS